MAWLLAASTALSGAGCHKAEASSETSAGTSPQALPAFTLRDDTSNILLTWIDDKGDFHTGQHPVEVPTASRGAVRVLPTDRDDPSGGELVYVADLTKKNTDGSYVIQTQSRSNWDSQAAQRRAALIAKVAPHAATPPSPSATGTTQAPTAGQPAITLYGAPWCGYCRQAKEYMHSKHIPFTYKDIEADSTAEEEMSQKLARVGRSGGAIPVIDVGGKIMVGFDPQQFDSLYRSVSRTQTLLLEAA